MSGRMSAKQSRMATQLYASSSSWAIGNGAPGRATFAARLDNLFDR
jgi:hypothetical protein